MIIEIAKLKPDITHYQGQENGEILEIDDDPTLRVTGRVAYDLQVQKVSQRLVVQGEVRVTIACECARCTTIFSTIIEDSAFLRDYELAVNTQELDITEDLRESLLLQIPYVPVCRADCRGLCPYCGRNRNEEDCDCQSDRGDNPWQVLEGLER